MQHSVREQSGAIVVAFAGEIDLEHSPQAREILLECVGRGQKVVVDLASVKYIASSGIASLIEALQRARAEGASFVLAAANGAVRQALELARLDRVFTLLERVEEGLRDDF